MKDDDKSVRKRGAMQRIVVVEEILRRSNPIGQSVSADEYDSYAPHIVSMVAQGCSLEQLCSQLEKIRVNMGMGPFGGADRDIAIEILRALRDDTGPT